MGTCGLLLFLTAVVVGSAQLVSVPFLTTTCKSNGDCKLPGDYCQSFRGLGQTHLCIPRTVSGLPPHYANNAAAALHPQTPAAALHLQTPAAALHPQTPLFPNFLASLPSCRRNADCPRGYYCGRMVTGRYSCNPLAAASRLMAYNPYMYRFRTDPQASDSAESPQDASSSSEAERTANSRD